MPTMGSRLLSLGLAGLVRRTRSLGQGDDVLGDDFPAAQGLVLVGDLEGAQPALDKDGKSFGEAFGEEADHPLPEDDDLVPVGLLFVGVGAIPLEAVDGGEAEAEAGSLGVDVRGLAT